jgi:hypothetical protein
MGCASGGRDGEDASCFYFFATGQRVPEAGPTKTRHHERLRIVIASPSRSALRREIARTADYEAETAVERELVLRLAILLWRLRRARQG